MSSYPITAVLEIKLVSLPCYSSTGDQAGVVTLLQQYRRSSRCRYPITAVLEVKLVSSYSRNCRYQVGVKLPYYNRDGDQADVKLPYYNSAGDRSDEQ